MNNVKLLDCTLREAPLDNLMWGDLSIRKLVDGLERAGTDIIEIGFLKDGKHKQGSTIFQFPHEIKPYIENKRKEILYIALVDYGRYDLSQLEENDGETIDAIRVCFKKHEIDKVIDYARKIKNKGYKVCIQHVDTLGYSDIEILSFIEKVNEFNPFAYSIVDTFGSMYEDDALHLVGMVERNLKPDIWLGFHGHNNLLLADSNAQRFIKESSRRKIIVDASLYGCGRSAGNAHTELIAQFLDDKYDCQYDVDEMLDLIDTVIASAKEKTTWGYCIPYFISGMYGAHSFNSKHLTKRHNIKSRDLREIIKKLDNTQKKAYDYALLEKLYVEHFDNPVDDSESISVLSKSLCNHDVLLLAPGQSVVDKKEDIENYIDIYHPIIIGVNNIIDGFNLDYVFYSSEIRYQNLRYQDIRIAGNPNIIITSNIRMEGNRGETVVDYASLIKSGWVYLDDSGILLMRLLQKCGINEIAIAGFDGYKIAGNDFYSSELNTNLEDKEKAEHNRETKEMLIDMKSRNPSFVLDFITPSIYDHVFVDI